MFSKQKKAVKDLIKAGKVPKELELKVDLKKVNWPVGVWSAGGKGVGVVD